MLYRPIQPVFLLLAIVASLVGCAQPRPYADLWLPQGEYASSQPATRPPAGVFDQRGEAAAHSAERSNPVGELTLHEAVRLTLSQSPQLLAEGWGVVAAEADATQSALRPNPRVGFNASNFAGPDGTDPVFERQTLMLSQVIELAGKREARQALGEADQRLAAWDYEQRRIDVAGQAASNYVAVVVAQQRVALARQQLEIAQAGYEIVDERVRAELEPGADRDRASVELTLARIAMQQAQQGLVSARAALAASWGAERADFELALGELGDPAPVPALETLRGLLENSPRVARWQDELEQRQRQVELEQANTVADPTLGAGLRFFPEVDDVAGVVELSVPLTVFDDNRHAVLAARFRLAQARALQDQARAEVSLALSRAYADYEAALFAYEAINGDALPAAERAYQAAIESYDAGVSEYLTVLESQRALLVAQGARLDATRDLHLSLIRLEQVTSTPLGR